MLNKPALVFVLYRPCIVIFPRLQETTRPFLVSPREHKNSCLLSINLIRIVALLEQFKLACSGCGVETGD
jgi:hypothetical protein